MPSTNSKIRSSNLIKPTTPTLSPKLRSRPRMSFFDGDGFLLQKLAGRQQGAPLLAC
jgi:hypothetical protein